MKDSYLLLSSLKDVENSFCRHANMSCKKCQSAPRKRSTRGFKQGVIVCQRAAALTTIRAGGIGHAPL